MINTLAQRDTLIQKFDKDMSSNAKASLRSASLNTPLLFAGETDKAFEDLQKSKASKERNINISFRTQDFRPPQQPKSQRVLKPWERKANQSSSLPKSNSEPQGKWRSSEKWNKPQQNKESWKKNQDWKFPDSKRGRGGARKFRYWLSNSHPVSPPRNPIFIPESSNSSGGRLQDFWESWEKMEADPWIVSTIRHGYNLEFNTKPLLSTSPVWGLNSKHPQVNLEIEKMLLKGALEEVQNHHSPGFYSRIFVVPKKTGDLRPVIDLKILNTHLKSKPFKMETPHSIRKSLDQNMWVFSIDLKDAYFHVPIHPASRKYLRICRGNQVFQFKALPFGYLQLLGFSPRSSNK